jgi:F0F1-type ATP synthase membrane subunit b/b'
MLSLDANVIIVFLIVWILLAVLTKLFFNPVRQVRDQREQEVDANLRSREETLGAYERSIQEIDAALREARSAAEAARTSLEDEALKEKSRMIAEIGAECKSQVEKARAELSGMMAEIKGQLESEASHLANEIEKKLLP